ncbi:MAG: SOS response-associated peptidase [Chlorobiota bacterium]|jgi:putative SOS response-associated peptidase YedK|nr:MAG: SOS response-associated peptidase [Chlorobiota bacterium]
MCGRFALVATSNDIEQEFGVSGVGPIARYNIAPSQEILTIVADGLARAAMATIWGFRRSDGGLLINIRSETAAERPHIRRLLEHGRCIIPASGFYEWVGPKQPYFLRPHSGLMGIAGLLVRERDLAAGKLVLRSAILTRAADPTLAHLHGRMPVIVPRALYGDWLSPSFEGDDVLRHICAGEPIPLQWYRVSARVGNVANDDPSLLEPSTDPTH